jgi:L-threonylcarbamoyladenylate synthase
LYTFASTDKLKEIVSEIPENKTIGRCILAWFFNIGLKKMLIFLIVCWKDTVAVRVPNHDLTLKLLRSLDFPLAAPSANPLDRLVLEHVANYFPLDLELVLQGGACKNGIESTIIGFEK